ncbi:sacsin N-terminal ATP-binding-like domain-containing protein [Undibacterium parvum]|uniref:ATP-binding protein n=2 Tax=Undibacterium TaxID=401469 RepID=A0A6M4A340_9BURK|nr:ATP-binding protein [Undibacterium parvum]AZP11203.1 ATP-binding protein [Undibacterium parvum]QJQ05726.1 hypothetical protein EJG51_007520 [Undibacterium piscinae]
MSQQKLSSVTTIFDEETISPSLDLMLVNAREWSEWLKQQQSVALQVYKIKPAQLIADQRREQGISRDYKGREILELLQNAADAAKKCDQRGDIRVELNPEGLIVANTGLGFTTGGVKSLQTADLSPKRGKKNQFIGSKGLGFRSVLNWSRQPIILSGSLQIAFSSRYAQELVERLRRQFSSVQEELAKHPAEDSVPLLPFPIDLNSDEHHGFDENSGIFGRCQALRAEGYETIIGMPFDRAHSYENAINQLKLLRPEFLLFSDSIASLSISVVANNKADSWEKLWRSDVISQSLITLIEVDCETEAESCSRWQLFTQIDEIPEEYLRDHDDPDSYHLVVALPEQGLAEPANLYSFFPTEIPLPLHALCHATLELTQNRKHLQEGEANEFVLERLALFLAMIFEQQTEMSCDSYRALDLLAPASLLQNYQTDIKTLQNALINAIKTKNVFPVLSGERLKATETTSFQVGGNSMRWLPEKIFPAIVIARNNSDKQLFDLLGVKSLDGKQFVSLLRAAGEISLEERAAVALGVINQGLGQEYCYKGLLIDSQGNELCEDDSVYLPGGSLGNALEFPTWAKIKILNEQLWEVLRGNKVRDSAKALSVFDVHEYALGNLIAGLVSSANAALLVHDENQTRSELLQSLFALYNLYQNNEDRPEFPKRLNVFLLNHNSKWRSTKELYYGFGYSATGNIVSQLYQSAPEKLTAEPLEYEKLGIKGNSRTPFLAWLGVSEWPNIMEIKTIEPAFLTFAKPRLKYPAAFIENTSHIFNSADELPRNCTFQSVKSLDGLDVILSSESDAILAWLASDPRTLSWLKPMPEHGTLGFLPSGCWNQRNYKGELPSYIFWKIKHSSWLSSIAGKPLAPVDCMVNDAAVAGLFPTPILPSKETILNLGLSHSLMKHALLAAGVRESIDDLDSEEIYSLMLELPAKDPSGNLAKKLYNWLIKTVDFKPDEGGKNYKTFTEKGSIFAKQGDVQEYFPVAETYHVDVEGFPQELLKSLPVASFLKKRGAGKVRRIFRVNVLDKEAVNEKVTHYNVAACSEQANKHFQTAKRYIEIYRHSQVAKAPGRAVFESLQLVVCNHVKSEITFRQQTLDNELPPWTYSIQADQLYVCCNPLYSDEPNNPLLANTIGDAIASIFELNDGNSFSNIYRCDEKNRTELLRKMLGDQLDDDLDAMLLALREQAVGQLLPEPLVTMGPVPKISLTVTTTPPSATPLAQTIVTESEPPVQNWNVPSTIGVESVEHVPESPGTRVRIRVSGGGSGSGSSAGRIAPTSDGKAGENLTMLFEQQQGRFPLYIGHITGYDTIAADVLSFRSADDLALFESGEDQNAVLVERVIEAKEKWAGGSVNLTVNEVNTAAQWKNKYYIYRFMPIKATTSEYELKVLCNPLSQLDAVTSSIEISLDIAATSQKFRVYGKINQTESI